VPNQPAPFIDPWAPAQYVAGTTGGQGPTRSPDPLAQLGAAVGGDLLNNYDATLHYKLAGTIILALLVVFGLQWSGFRFVGAVNVGFGGRS
jgi:hypothetical protein